MARMHEASAKIGPIVMFGLVDALECSGRAEEMESIWFPCDCPHHE